MKDMVKAYCDLLDEIKLCKQMREVSNNHTPYEIEITKQRVSIRLSWYALLTTTNCWMVYRDTASMMWDVVEDDNIGAIGSNWYPTTLDDAEEFIRDMRGAEGWTRGHDNAPRF